MFTTNINYKKSLTKINPEIGDLVRFNIGDKCINSYYTVYGIIVNSFSLHFPEEGKEIDNLFLVINYNNNNYLLNKDDVELFS